MSSTSSHQPSLYSTELRDNYNDSYINQPETHSKRRGQQRSFRDQDVIDALFNDIERRRVVEFYPGHRTLSGRYAVPRPCLASSVMRHKTESKRVKTPRQSLDDDISPMLQIKAFEYYSEGKQMALPDIPKFSESEDTISPSDSCSGSLRFRDSSRFYGASGRQEILELLETKAIRKTSKRQMYRSDLSPRIYGGVSTSDCPELSCDDTPCLSPPPFDAVGPSEDNPEYPERAEPSGDCNIVVVEDIEVESTQMRVVDCRNSSTGRGQTMQRTERTEPSEECDTSITVEMVDEKERMRVSDCTSSTGRSKDFRHEEEKLRFTRRVESCSSSGSASPHDYNATGLCDDSLYREAQAMKASKDDRKKLTGLCSGPSAWSIKDTRRSFQGQIIERKEGSEKGGLILKEACSTQKEEKGANRNRNLIQDSTASPPPSSPLEQGSPRHFEEIYNEVSTKTKTKTVQELSTSDCCWTPSPPHNRDTNMLVEGGAPETENCQDFEKLGKGSSPPSPTDVDTREQTGYSVNKEMQKAPKKENERNSYQTSCCYKSPHNLTNTHRAMQGKEERSNDTKLGHRLTEAMKSPEVLDTPATNYLRSTSTHDDKEDFGNPAVKALREKNEAERRKLQRCWVSRCSSPRKDQDAQEKLSRQIDKEFAAEKDHTLDRTKGIELLELKDKKEDGRTKKNSTNEERKPEELHALKEKTDDKQKHELCASHIDLHREGKGKEEDKAGNESQSPCSSISSGGVPDDNCETKEIKHKPFHRSCCKKEGEEQEKEVEEAQQQKWSNLHWGNEISAHPAKLKLAEGMDCEVQEQKEVDDTEKNCPAEETKLGSEPMRKSSVTLATASAHKATRFIETAESDEEKLNFEEKGGKENREGLCSGLSPWTNTANDDEPTEAQRTLQPSPPLSPPAFDAPDVLGEILSNMKSEDVESKESKEMHDALLCWSQWPQNEKDSHETSQRKGRKLASPVAKHKTQLILTGSKVFEQDKGPPPSSGSARLKEEDVLNRRVGTYCCSPPTWSKNPSKALPPKANHKVIDEKEDQILQGLVEHPQSYPSLGAPEHNVTALHKNLEHQGRVDAKEKKTRGSPRFTAPCWGPTSQGILDSHQALDGQEKEKKSDTAKSETIEETEEKLKSKGEIKAGYLKHLKIAKLVRASEEGETRRLKAGCWGAQPDEDAQTSKKVNDMKNDNSVTGIRNEARTDASSMAQSQDAVAKIADTTIKGNSEAPIEEAGLLEESTPRCWSPWPWSAERNKHWCWTPPALQVEMINRNKKGEDTRKGLTSSEASAISSKRGSTELREKKKVTNISNSPCCWSPSPVHGNETQAEKEGAIEEGTRHEGRGRISKDTADTEYNEGGPMSWMDNKKLREQEGDEVIASFLEYKADDSPSTASNHDNTKISDVTKAEEQIEQTAKEAGVTIKVDTHGCDKLTQLESENLQERQEEKEDNETEAPPLQVPFAITLDSPTQNWTLKKDIEECEVKKIEDVLLHQLNCYKTLLGEEGEEIDQQTLHSATQRRATPTGTKEPKEAHKAIIKVHTDAEEEEVRESTSNVDEGKDATDANGVEEVIALNVRAESVSKPSVDIVMKDVPKSKAAEDTKELQNPNLILGTDTKPIKNALSERPPDNLVKSVSHDPTSPKESFTRASQEYKKVWQFPEGKKESVNKEELKVVQTLNISAAPPTTKAVGSSSKTLLQIDDGKKASFMGPARKASAPKMVVEVGASLKEIPKESKSIQERERKYSLSKPRVGLKKVKSLRSDHVTNKNKQQQQDCQQRYKRNSSPSAAAFFEFLIEDSLQEDDNLTMRSYSPRAQPYESTPSPCSTTPTIYSQARNYSINKRRSMSPKQPFELLHSTSCRKEGERNYLKDLDCWGAQEALREHELRKARVGREPNWRNKPSQSTVPSPCKQSYLDLRPFQQKAGGVKGDQSQNTRSCSSSEYSEEDYTKEVLEHNKKKKAGNDPQGSQGQEGEKEAAVSKMAMDGPSTPTREISDEDAKEGPQELVQRLKQGLETTSRKRDEQSRSILDLTNKKPTGCTNLKLEVAMDLAMLTQRSPVSGRRKSSFVFTDTPRFGCASGEVSIREIPTTEGFEVPPCTPISKEEETYLMDTVLTDIVKLSITPLDHQPSISKLRDGVQKIKEKREAQASRDPCSKAKLSSPDTPCQRTYTPRFSREIERQTTKTSVDALREAQFLEELMHERDCLQANASREAQLLKELTNEKECLQSKFCAGKSRCEIEKQALEERGKRQYDTLTGKRNESEEMVAQLKREKDAFAEKMERVLTAKEKEIQELETLLATKGKEGLDLQNLLTMKEKEIEGLLQKGDKDKKTLEEQLKQALVALEKEKLELVEKRKKDLEIMDEDLKTILAAKDTEEEVLMAQNWRESQVLSNELRQAMEDREKDKKELVEQAQRESKKKAEALKEALAKKDRETEELIDNVKLERDQLAQQLKETLAVKDNDIAYLLENAVRKREALGEKLKQAEAINEERGGRIEQGRGVSKTEEVLSKIRDCKEFNQPELENKGKDPIEKGLLKKIQASTEFMEQVERERREKEIIAEELIHKRVESVELMGQAERENKLMAEELSIKRKESLKLLEEAARVKEEKEAIAEELKWKQQENVELMMQVTKEKTEKEAMVAELRSNQKESIRLMDRVAKEQEEKEILTEELTSKRRESMELMDQAVREKMDKDAIAKELSSKRRESMDLIEQAAKEKKKKEDMTEDLRKAVKAKEMAKRENCNLLAEIKQLQEENVALKEEVLRVESEWFELEKRKSNSEKSQRDLILRRLAKEKEEAQRLAAQVSSEVQILRHNSIMVEEKLVCMSKLHEQKKECKADHKLTVEMLEKLIRKSDEWADRAQVVQQALEEEREIFFKNNSSLVKLQEAMEIERQTSSTNNKNVFMLSETTAREIAASKVDKGDSCEAIRTQLCCLVEELQMGLDNLKTLTREENERMQQEHRHLRSLQESLQKENRDSLADLASERQRVERVQESYIREKEALLAKSREERRDLEAEREIVSQIKKSTTAQEAELKEQLTQHAARMTQIEAEREEIIRLWKSTLAQESHLRYQLAQHSARLKFETQEIEKQCPELKRAREMATQIPQVIEETAQNIEISGISSPPPLPQPAPIGKHELIEFKQMLEEERRLLASERQQLANQTQEMIHATRAYLQLTTSHMQTPRSVLGPEQPSCYGGFASVEIYKGCQQMTRKTSSKICRKHNMYHVSGECLAELNESSMCLHKQDRFLKEASQVLRQTTQATKNLVARNNSSNLSAGPLSFQWTCKVYQSVENSAPCIAENPNPGDTP